ncbi:hypothetical protein [Priestia koreensis]|uniref:hypothetical protein n=1 Tax=Priestia koreensis TaxID=284581 RepID=UPI00345867BB
MSISIGNIDNHVEKFKNNRAYLNHVEISIKNNKVAKNTSAKPYDLSVNMDFHTKSNVLQDDEYYENIGDSLFFIENRVLIPMYNLFAENFVARVYFNCHGELDQDRIEISSHIHFENKGAVNMGTIMEKVTLHLNPYVMLANSITCVSLKGISYKLSKIKFDMTCTIKDITGLAKAKGNAQLRSAWFIRIQHLVKKVLECKDFKFEFVMPVLNGQFGLNILSQVINVREEIKLKRD